VASHTGVEAGLAGLAEWIASRAWEGTIPRRAASRTAPMAIDHRGGRAASLLAIAMYQSITLRVICST
jgi:hypothetical protein